MDSIQFARSLDLEALVLLKGAHAADGNEMCIMEAVAYVAGEPWSDHPQCASEVIGEFCRSWNDSLNDDDRNRLLKPLIPKLIGTRKDAALETRLAWMATDWLVRVYTPAWCDLVEGLKSHAAELRNLAELTDTESATIAMPTIRATWDAARTAWATARAAAPATARAAAGHAAGSAAGSAAGHAAGNAALKAALNAAGHAAGSAVGDAARKAALKAAGAAAWSAAGDALSPTVALLQDEAVVLLERMIATAKAWEVAQ